MMDSRSVDSGSICRSNGSCGIADAHAIDERMRHAQRKIGREVDAVGIEFESRQQRARDR